METGRTRSVSPVNNNNNNNNNNTNNITIIKHHHSSSATFAQSQKASPKAGVGHNNSFGADGSTSLGNILGSPSFRGFRKEDIARHQNSFENKELLLSGASSRHNSIDDVEFQEDEQRHLLAVHLQNSSPSRDKKKIESLPSLTLVFLYALINVAISVPSLIGYASVIFRHPVFSGNIDELAAIVILSSAVHQLVFFALSSLPFAIAQVQDAGLIFLSAMATSIAKQCADPIEALATTLVVLSIATASLGVVVTMVGQFRLGSFISHIPMPIVAGFLAYIGLFCLLAGLALATGLDISNVQDLLKFDVDSAVLAFPAIASGVVLSFVSRNAPAKYWWALPATIVMIPIVFYVLLYMTGKTLQDSRNEGWVAESPRYESVTSVIAMFQFSKVKWSVIPSLFLTWLSMTLLVVFSSALDIIAVELDLGGEQLDIDRELRTVGISNIVSGLLGGYTGSYIFSQTNFTRRTGINSRFIGLILAVIEIGIFFLPFSVMSIVPRFFFAATLIFVAFDLLHQYLLMIAVRVSTREFSLVLLTFLAITFAEDLVIGIGIGVCGSLLNFAFSYSGISPIQPGQRHSNVLRDFECRKIVAAARQSRIISLKLQGYLFFGSSAQILLHVKKALDLQNAHNEIFVLRSKQGSSSKTTVYKTPTSPVLESIPKKLSTATDDSQSSSTLLSVALKSTPSSMTNNNVGTEQHQSSINYGTISRNLNTLNSGEETDDTNQSKISDLDSKGDEANFVTPMRRFLVIDFQNVTGMDSSAVSTGLLRVRMLALSCGVTVVFTSLKPEFYSLLKANDVLGDDVIVEQTADDGLDWCESQILREYRSATAQDQRSEINDLLPGSKRPFVVTGQPSLSQDLWRKVEHKSVKYIAAEKKARRALRLLIESFFGWGVGKPSINAEQAAKLAEYWTLLTVRRGDVIFDTGFFADAIYLVLTGEIVLYKPSGDWRALSYEERARIVESKDRDELTFGRERALIQRARYGSMIGELYYSLQAYREFGAIAESDACLFVLTSSSLEKLTATDPSLGIAIHKIIARSLALTLAFKEDYDETV